MSEGSQNTGAATRKWLHILVWVISLGGLSGLIASQFDGKIALVGVGILIGMSSATVGASLGFLFAVPRVLSAESTTENAEAKSRSRLLGSNTNLEKISDWLTTMLVGVGLSQLSNIGPALESFSAFLARAATVDTDGTAGPLPAIGPFLLVLGLLGGFLFFYLQTRIILVPELKRVEEDLQLAGPAGTRVKEAAEDLASKTGNLVSRQIAKGSLPSVEDAIRLMREWLYQPGGYGKVIELAKDLENSPAAKRPDYWFLSAAAYGQKHTHARSAEEKAEAREGLLRAARKAISLDATYKRRLWELTNRASYDNDLVDFGNDKEFRSIVGRDQAEK